MSLTQVFGLWFIPFHRAQVNLTTVLELKHNRSDEKYYIQSQNDLYQTDEFVKFLIPPSWILVWLWQFWATFFCALGATALWPITYAEEWILEEAASRNRQKDTGEEEKKTTGDLLDGMDMRDLERKAVVNKSSR